MKGVFAGIVTYNPEISRLKENLESIIHQVDIVVIWDNGSTNIREIEKLYLLENKLLVIRDGVNKGIAHGLNQICRWGYNNGYQWVLTLDQDSVCPEQLIDKLYRFSENDNVAIISPRIVYRYNESISKKKNIGDIANFAESVDWVITSASLTRISSWKEIGGFDDRLFIDKVDYDFCYRLKQSGYLILRVNDVALLHELGNMNCKRIGHRIIHVTNHQPIRYYYMSRNTIFLKKKLGYGTPTLDILKIIFKVTLYEGKKADKLKAIIRGILDGTKMRRFT